MSQARFYSSDALPTTLSASLGTTGNPSVASLPGTWPSQYPYTVLIDWGLAGQEAISVTGPPTGSGPFTLPCTRAIDGSTGGAGGLAHAAGAVVVHGVTAQDFDQPLKYIDGVSGFPWEFSILNPAYGSPAVGNGQLITDAVITGGALSTLTTLSSTPFSASMVGQTVIVNGAGNATYNGPLITTFSAYVANNQMTLATPATTAVSGACAYFGSDDNPAFIAAGTAAGAYLATNSLAKVLIPPPPNGLFYMVAGALVTTGGANAQIPIPAIANAGTTQKATLVYEWLPGDSAMPLWSQEQAQVAGAVVSAGMYASAAAYTSNYSVNGLSCVFGSTPNFATGSGGADSLPPFSNIHVVLKNPKIVTPANDYGLQYTPVNLAGCATGRVENPSVLVTKNYFTASGPDKHVAAGTLANAYAFGIVPPANGNNDQSVIINPTVSGYGWAFLVGEHARIEGGRVVQCCYTVGVDGTGYNQTENAHLVKIDGLSSELCQFGIQVIGAGSPGFSIDASIDTEGFGGGAGSFISDTTSGTGLASLYGDIRVYGHHSDNIFGPKYPVSFKLWSFGNTAPGWIFGYTGFSSAGTGVAVQNPYWRDARVCFSGGIVTAVSAGVTIGGTGGSSSTAPSMTATGLTGSGTVDWPSGGWLSFAWSGSPTWNVCVS